MELVVLKQVERELRAAPSDVVVDVFSLFDDLTSGKNLSMPISRPLPSIARGLHELRLSGKSGEFRAYYVIKIRDAIYVVHATKKKTQKIDSKTTALLRSRIKGLGL